MAAAVAASGATSTGSSAIIAGAGPPAQRHPGRGVGEDGQLVLARPALRSAIAARRYNARCQSSSRSSQRLPVVQQEATRCCHQQLAAPSRRSHWSGLVRSGCTVCCLLVVGLVVLLLHCVLSCKSTWLMLACDRLCMLRGCALHDLLSVPVSCCSPTGSALTGRETNAREGMVSTAAWCAVWCGTVGAACKAVGVWTPSWLRPCVPHAGGSWGFGGVPQCHSHTVGHRHHAVLRGRSCVTLLLLLLLSPLRWLLL